MGCVQSSNPTAEDTMAEKRSNSIDQELKREKSLQKNTIKMLLLGAGESGKSTVVKQIKLIHQGSYSPGERQDYSEVIVANVVQSMQAILNALPDLDINLDQETEIHATLVSLAPADAEMDLFREELARSIFELYKSRPIQQAIRLRNRFQLNDSAEYFFNAVPRIASLDYVPSDEDILHSRVKTTGVIEHQIKINGRLFKLTDVGGQRSERRKWLNVFSDVEVLLFVTSLAEYDQKLREDQTMSRMTESLTLFETVVNSSWFERSTIILFLNKIDLFRQKLPIEPLSSYLEGFPADHNTDAEYAAKHLKHRFLALHHNQSKVLYTHMTCATDTSAMKNILKAVIDSVLRKNFESVGIL